MSAKRNPISPVDMAHFKFGVIAPVIQGLYPDVSEAAFYRRITSSPLKLPNGEEKCYSPDTLEKWVTLYRRFGYDGLLPAVRKDKGTSRKLDGEARQEIYRLREQFPNINGVMIHDCLIKGGFITASVSPRAVQRFIKENDLKSARDPLVRDRKAFEMSFFGELWQADTAYMPHITENGRSRRPYLIMIVDDHSRMIVGGEIFYNDNAINFQKVLKDAIATYGIPDKLYMDNGSPYRNDQLSMILDSIGIVEAHTKVRDGASKGKVERNFRTLRNRWLSVIDVSEISSLEEFNRRLNDYIRQHNTTVHSVTGEMPITRFERSREYPRTPKSEGWLNECFLNRIKRRVRSDSCITLKGVEYDVPSRFRGMQVEVRFMPDDPDNAFILYGDEHFPISRTNRVANGKARRRNDLPALDFTDLVDTEPMKGENDAV